MMLALDNRCNSTHHTTQLGRLRLVCLTTQNQGYDQCHILGRKINLCVNPSTCREWCGIISVSPLTLSKLFLPSHNITVLQPRSDTYPDFKCCYME